MQHVAQKLSPAADAKALRSEYVTVLQKDKMVSLYTRISCVYPSLPIYAKVW